MRAFRWVFITVGVVAVVVLLAIAVGAAWLNTFIHSDPFRREVETRASQTLGGPVQITAIDLGLFSGVKLSGVATQVDSNRVNGQGALVAKVESVNCTYALGDLLQRRLKVTGLTLEKPQIILTRQAVAVPAAPPAPSDAAATGEAPAGTPPFQFVLEGAKINDGSLSIRSASGAVLTDLNGIGISADTSGYYENRAITGKLQIADAAFAPNLHVTDLATPWTFDPRGNFLDAKPLEASAFGGKLAGGYTLDNTGPSVLDLNAKGLDVGQLGRAATPSSPARLTGSLDLQSKWRGAETGQLNGEGDLQLADGRLEGVRLLQELAGILRVPELGAPRLRQVQTHFQITNGQTRFTGLQLDATVFRMTGDGVIGADGALDANMVLILSRDAMGRIPHEASSFFVQQQDGAGSIGFHLGGTVDNPSTDLGTRLLMQGAAVKNVISNALDRFFHKKKAAPAPGP